MHCNEPTNGTTTTSCARGISETLYVVALRPTNKNRRPCALSGTDKPRESGTRRPRLTSAARRCNGPECIVTRAERDSANLTGRHTVAGF